MKVFLKIVAIVSLSLLNFGVKADDDARVGHESGGGPDIILVQCENSIALNARAGQETSKIKATVIDRDLTNEPRYFDVGFSFVGEQVHFAVNKPGAPKDGFYLQIDTKKRDGIFIGELTIDRKVKQVQCTVLNDRFRPMASRKVNAEFLHGGKNCNESGQCVEYIGGPAPDKINLPLVFNVKSGQLEGKWSVEKDVFNAMVVFELQIFQKRDQPLIHQFTISFKDKPNPSQISVEGENQKIYLQTAALEVDAGKVSIWQKAKVSISEK